MSDSITEALRAGLEAWERDAAAQWDAFIRSPSTLHRIGEQIRLTLEAQQRLRERFEARVPEAAAHRQTVRMHYLLERMERQIAFLADRIAQLENALNHD